MRGASLTTKEAPLLKKTHMGQYAIINVETIQRRQRLLESFCVAVKKVGMAEKYMMEESYGDPQPDLYVGFLAGFKTAIKLIITKIED